MIRTNINIINMASQKSDSPMAFVVSVIFLGITTMLWFGCDRTSSTKPVASSTSVSDMLTKLPNLKPIAIDSCSYTVEKNSAARGVPSPSDVRMS